MPTMAGIAPSLSTAHMSIKEKIAMRWPTSAISGGPDVSAHVRLAESEANFPEKQSRSTDLPIWK